MATGAIDALEYETCNAPEDSVVRRVVLGVLPADRGGRSNSPFSVVPATAKCTVSAVGLGFWRSKSLAQT